MSAPPVIESPPHEACVARLRLPRAEWSRRQRAHEARVDPWIRPHLERSSRGERHPVHDFLFEYYSQRPSQLRRWSPGLGVVLEDAGEFLGRAGFAAVAGGIILKADDLKPDRFAFALWLCNMLAATKDRPPFFGCAGLHEWAMVYRTEQPRHPAVPLRYPVSKINEIVESLPIRCSHYDAFRFFTPDARPLNRLQPSRVASPELEQPGCLHANMDLYKWSYKLAPFVPSELMADAFALARDIREVDMRASPYDLSAFGFDSIPIESAEGRSSYEQLQRQFANRAVPIRAALLDVCERILAVRT